MLSDNIVMLRNINGYSQEEVAERIRTNLLQQKQNEAYTVKAMELRKKYMGE